MLINLKGQVGSGLDRDSVPNWPQQMQRNICSLCVTQRCPLGAPGRPQEPGNGSKSRAASPVTNADWTLHTANGEHYTAPPGQSSLPQIQGLRWVLDRYRRCCR
ncbi:unnamed protein product [Pleuronectes platessa]|uniref:Uncharacterized protein n=1 Tax=Pleuronectes platessa TaxID=8262 RepID=A0A9N7Z6S0_PLEPL|nr:unnamed protein product [Pleuronectes platessa]